MAQAILPANDNRHVFGDLAPMSEMNTTPLIDVMLVLLIMFIITVPVQSHKVGMQLPGKPPEGIVIERVKNDLSLSTAGQLSWNGKPISDAQLAQAMSAISAMTDQPEVHFRPDPVARYQRVDEVLGIAARSGIDRFGFAGNEQYGQVF